MHIQHELAKSFLSMLLCVISQALYINNTHTVFFMHSMLLVLKFKDLEMR